MRWFLCKFQNNYGGTLNGTYIDTWYLGIPIPYHLYIIII